MSETKKAILAVSFGTSFPETRAKTIDCIEADLAAAFPDRKVYRAWTSGMIIRKLARRDGIHIDTISQAMETMLADGITDVLVQPSHILNGIENDKMVAEVLAFQADYERICFGSPLLSSTEDNKAVLEAILSDWELAAGEVLVFMGHGTEHDVNPIYAVLDRTLKEIGYPNAFMGTVEAFPSLDDVMKQVQEYKPKKVHLTPFMIVAGDHANNDMAGDDEDSWKSRFEAAGFAVECHLKGLGEYPGIRRIIAEHAKNSIEQS